MGQLWRVFRIGAEIEVWQIELWHRPNARTACPTPGPSFCRLWQRSGKDGNQVLEISSPEMHGFLAGENLRQADLRKFFGHGAATAEKFIQFFLKRGWRGFGVRQPGELRARGGAGGSIEVGVWRLAWRFRGLASRIDRNGPPVAD